MLKPKKHLGGNKKCYIFATVNEKEHAAAVVKHNESGQHLITSIFKNHGKEDS